MQPYIIATCNMYDAGVQVNKLKQRLADSKESRLYLNIILKSPLVYMIYPNVLRRALKVMHDTFPINDHQIPSTEAG